MRCSEFKSLMALFLKGRLDSLQLEGFANHAVECSACETELLAIVNSNQE